MNLTFVGLTHLTAQRKIKIKENVCILTFSLSSLDNVTQEIFCFVFFFFFFQKSGVEEGFAYYAKLFWDSDTPR